MHFKPALALLAFFAAGQLAAAQVELLLARLARI